MPSLWPPAQIVANDSMCCWLLQRLRCLSYSCPASGPYGFEAVVVFTKELPCCTARASVLMCTASILQVRKLLQQLRVSRQSATGGASANVVEVVEACKTLTSLFQDHPELKQLFLAEGGGVAMMEVLEERSNKVGAGWLAGSGASRLERGSSQRDAGTGLRACVTARSRAGYCSGAGTGQRQGVA